MTIASTLALVLVPLFGITDYFAYPSQLVPLWGVRLLSVLASVAILLALRGRVGRHYTAVLGMALSFEVGLAIAVVPVYVNGIDTPHYVSLALLILAVAALLPWSATQVGVNTVALGSTFIAAALLGSKLSSPKAFFTEVSAILVTGAIAVVITSLGEAVRKREYAARCALRAASREKTRLIADLREKTTELQSLNQEMEDLLYVSSHDLRAPLINVQGFATELHLELEKLQPYVSETPEATAIQVDLRESLRFIQTAVMRMDTLISGLLNVSRVATRTTPTDDVRLQNAVEKIVESFRYQLEQQQITVTVQPLPTVRGDSVRLNQVFSNLVDNAIKYMGDRPHRHIEIGMRNGKGVRTFFVRDTGPGIPVKSQETVFRLFRRLETKVPGEGLGLTLVRKIIEKHGGHIWVESALGHGSTFCFTLGTHAESVHDPGENGLGRANGAPSPTSGALSSGRDNGVGATV